MKQRPKHRTEKPENLWQRLRFGQPWGKPQEQSSEDVCLHDEACPTACVDGCRMAATEAATRP